MIPSAPGLLSITIVCPSDCDSAAATIRAVTSVVPPVPKATTARTGLVGYCAWASSGKASRAARKSFFMGSDDRSFSSSYRLDDLPVRILPDDPAVAEFPMVAAAHSEPGSIEHRASQQPLGHAHVSAHPVPVIPVMDVRKSLEARSQALAHRRFAGEAFTPRVRPARHIQ